MSAWASEQSVVLAQRAVSADSNEITAIPDVLSRAGVGGRARHARLWVGTQKEIAQRIRDRKGDYLLVLKANHGKAYEAVESHFEQQCLGRGAMKNGGQSRLVFDAFDESHGRLVRRRVFACSDAG